MLLSHKITYITYTLHYFINLRVISFVAYSLTSKSQNSPVFGEVPVVAAPAAGEAQESNAAKTVVLKNAGGNKIAVIKLLKEITGLGLVEAKALADNGGNVKENVPADEANQIKAQLEEAGAEIELA